MHTQERLQSERAFHDRQAAERRSHLSNPEALLFTDDTYLDHESWIRPALEKLEPLRELPLLDLGCGHGMASVVLARRGACVTALDLSAGYLSEARRRAEANGVTVQLVQGNGELLPFADASFARIWGNAILHHLDLRKAAAELFRVLRPGGVAVFCEPWGGNPLLAWARRYIPYPNKGRTADEQPLRTADLSLLRRFFPELEVEGFQLLSMVGRVLRPGQLLTRLKRIDARLLKRMPQLQQFCRYLVLTLRR